MDAMVLERDEYQLTQLKLKKTLWLLFSLLLASFMLVIKVLWLKFKSIIDIFNFNDADLSYRDNYYLRDAEIRSYLELKI